MDVAMRDKQEIRPSDIPIGHYHIIEFIILMLYRQSKYF